MHTRLCLRGSVEYKYELCSFVTHLFTSYTHLFLTGYLTSLLCNHRHMLAFIVVSSLNFGKKLRHKYHYLLSTYTLCYIFFPFTSLLYFPLISHTIYHAITHTQLILLINIASYLTHLFTFLCSKLCTY